MADQIMPMRNGIPNANLNSHPSNSPKSPTANRLSLSNTPSASPKLVAAPVSPVQSVVTELDHTPVVSPRSSAVPSAFTSIGPSRTVDRLDAPESEDELGAKSISDFSDYPEGSDVGIKSPPFKRGMRAGGSKDSPAEATSPDTAGFGSYQHSAALIANSSTAGDQVSRESIDDQIQAADTQRKESSDSRISDVAELSGAVPPIILEAVGDSPTLGRFPMTMTVEPPKVPHGKFLARNWSTKVQRSQSPIQDAFDISPTDTRTERGRHMPFLPKFLRLTSDGRDEEEKRRSNEVKKGGLPGVKEEPKSFFNSDSSDDEEGESPVVVHAKHASMIRPAVVDHSPSRSPSRQLTRSKEMLRGRQRLAAEDNSGPSRAKAARFLGEDVSVVEAMDAKRGGIVGTPPATELDAKDDEGVFGSTKGMNIWKDPIPNYANGLRSHPVQPAVPAIPEKSSKRKVSFPVPPLVEVKPEHRFLRQSIVSTPYPPDSPAKEGGGAQSLPSGQAPTGLARPKTVLTLVLYSHGNRAPRIKKIVIPDSQEHTLVDSDEKRPEYRATLKIDFDDERLFKLIRAQFAGMRGYFRTIASARSVNSLKLESFTTLSQLAARHEGPVYRWTLTDQVGTFAEQQLFNLYKNPRLGKGKHYWTDWIKFGSSKSTDDSSQVEDEKLALEVTESWCFPKIASVVAAILILSLVVTLLWTFRGSDVTIESVIGDKGSFKEAELELRGRKGDRLGAGAALGLLVLLFGWTGLGGWMLLSWIAT